MLLKEDELTGEEKMFYEKFKEHVRNKEREAMMPPQSDYEKERRQKQAEIKRRIDVTMHGNYEKEVTFSTDAGNEGKTKMILIDTAAMKKLHLDLIIQCMIGFRPGWSSIHEDCWTTISWGEPHKTVIQIHTDLTDMEAHFSILEWKGDKEP